jgi:hypothetical protein
MIMGRPDETTPFVPRGKEFAQSDPITGPYQRAAGDRSNPGSFSTNLSKDQLQANLNAAQAAVNAATAALSQARLAYQAAIDNEADREAGRTQKAGSLIQN